MSGEKIESRRTFIRMSALAVGVLGGAGALGVSDAEAQFPHGPEYDYPWNVAVGTARVHLYLLGDVPIATILSARLNMLVDFMHQSLVAAEGTDHERKITQALGKSFFEIRQGFSDAKNALQNVTQTYEFFVTNKRAQWGGAETPLTNLSTLVPVPVLNFSEETANDQRKAAQDFLNATVGNKTNRQLIMDDYNHRSLFDLFTTAHGDIGANERGLWQEARDRGLIWCNPRKNADQTLMANSSGIAFQGNSKKCNALTHRCETTTDPNDYCQEVDGVCNAMGT